VVAYIGSLLVCVYVLHCSAVDWTILTTVTLVSTN